MAELMVSLYEELGLQVQWQQVEDGRANALGTWRGTGGGKTLMFNGHMDTSYSGREPWLKDVAGLPAARVRARRPSVRARHLEHEGRARLLRRGGARAPGRRRAAARRRADRRGLRRDREDAVRRCAGRRVPRLRGRLALPRLARRRRRHVPARRADRGQGRARPLRRALAAHPRARQLHPHGLQRGQARPELDPAHARGDRRRARVDSDAGRTTRRTPTAAPRRSSTSARSKAASAGASRGLPITRTCSSTCAFRRPSRWRSRGARCSSSSGCSASASPTTASRARSTSPPRAPRSTRTTRSSRRSTPRTKRSSVSGPAAT